MSKVKNACLAGSMVATLIATPFIVRWEGQENAAYQDIVGVWTICSGETQNVYKGQYLTDSECAALTQERVREFAEWIDDHVSVELQPETHAALTSWVYNVGKGAASRSTLLRKLNNGDYDGACTELLRWNRAGGRVIQGLKNRRLDEYQLCMEGVK